MTQDSASIASPSRGRYVFLALAALVMLANAVIMRWPPVAFTDAAGLAPEWPVLVDALVTLPLLYLLLVGWRGWRAWRAAAAVGMTALALSAWIVPEQSRHVLDMLKPLRHLAIAIVIAVECVAVVAVVRFILRMRREGLNAETAIERAMVDRFGDGAFTRLLVLDARIWFYALFARAGKPLAFPGDTHFTVHAKDGNASNQLVFIFLILFELPILHGLLMVMASAQVAWIVTVLTLWGLAFLVADYRASLLRPISLDGDALVIRYGVLVDVRVPLAAIASVQRWNEEVPGRQPGTLRYCESGVPNVRIDLAEPLDVPGLFGGSRRVERVFLGVDTPVPFVAALEQRRVTGASEHEATAV